MKLYRRKFILADGRKVYATKRGKIDPVSQELVNNPIGFANMAYSTDLRFVSFIELMESNNQPYVRVIAQVFEPSTDPIDPEAFILGGIKPS